MAFEVFICPSLKVVIWAPRAAVAAPNTKASTTARPTMNTVALPTHITFFAALLTISVLLPSVERSEQLRATLRGRGS
jgi:hypothetical protein